MAGDEPTGVSTVAIGRPSSYTAEQRQRALVELAKWNGNSVEASKGLAEDGIDIPNSTLRHWRNVQYAKEYAEIKAGLQDVTRQLLAAEFEEFARSAVQKQQAMVDRLDPESIDPKELPKAIQQLGIPGGIATDKSQALRDRPTVIVEHRSGAEWLDAIARKFPQAVIDSDAEEITDAEEASADG